MRTEADIDCFTKMKEFSLSDLEREMNEQVQQMKY